MRILFLHDYDFRFTVGGAEINLNYAFENPPSDIRVDFMLNRNFLRRKVKDYDKIVFGNTRHMTPTSVIRAVDILNKLKIPYIKSEHDVMWSDPRVGLEIEFEDPMTYLLTGKDYTKNVWYQPTKYLFENAEKVRYLSPKHKLIFTGVDINAKETFIAGSYVDKEIFYDKILFKDRSYDAFVKANDLWGEGEGKKIAHEKGHKVVLLDHRGLNMPQMCDFYNQFRYYYDFPILHTTYSRVAIEFALCGGELVLKHDHALMSFGSIEKAIENSQTAIPDFWNGVLK